MTKDDDGLQTDFSATRCTWGSSLGSILDFDPGFDPGFFEQGWQLKPNSLWNWH